MDNFQPALQRARKTVCWTSKILCKTKGNKIVCMGMFDYYKIKPPVYCFVCSFSLAQWQGKEGGCLLFVWETGQLSPIDWKVDKELIRAPEKLQAERLPAKFTIYPVTVNCRECPTSAMGICENQKWVKTTIYYPHEKQLTIGWQENYADYEIKYWAQ